MVPCLRAKNKTKQARLLRNLLVSCKPSNNSVVLISTPAVASEPALPLRLPVRPSLAGFAAYSSSLITLLQPFAFYSLYNLIILATISAQCPVAISPAKGAPQFTSTNTKTCPIFSHEFHRPASWSACFPGTRQP